MSTKDLRRKTDKRRADKRRKTEKRRIDTMYRLDGGMYHRHKGGKKYEVRRTYRRDKR